MQMDLYAKAILGMNLWEKKQFETVLIPSYPNAKVLKLPQISSAKVFCAPSGAIRTARSLRLCLIHAGWYMGHLAFWTWDARAKGQRHVHKVCSLELHWSIWIYLRVVSMFSTCAHILVWHSCKSAIFCLSYHAISLFSSCCFLFFLCFEVVFVLVIMASGLPCGRGLWHHSHAFHPALWRRFGGWIHWRWSVYTGGADECLCWTSYGLRQAQYWSESLCVVNCCDVRVPSSMLLSGGICSSWKMWVTWPSGLKTEPWSSIRPRLPDRPVSDGPACAWSSLCWRSWRFLVSIVDMVK